MRGKNPDIKKSPTRGQGFALSGRQSCGNCEKLVRILKYRSGGRRRKSQVLSGLREEGWSHPIGQLSSATYERQPLYVEKQRLEVGRKQSKSAYEWYF